MYQQGWRGAVLCVGEQNRLQLSVTNSKEVRGSWRHRWPLLSFRGHRGHQLYSAINTSPRRVRTISMFRGDWGTSAFPIQCQDRSMSPWRPALSGFAFCVPGQQLEGSRHQQTQKKKKTRICKASNVWEWSCTLRQKIAVQDTSQLGRCLPWTPWHAVQAQAPIQWKIHSARCTTESNSCLWPSNCYLLPRWLGVNRLVHLGRISALKQLHNGLICSLNLTVWHLTIM